MPKEGMKKISTGIIIPGMSEYFRETRASYHLRTPQKIPGTPDKICCNWLWTQPSHQIWIPAQNTMTGNLPQKNYQKKGRKCSLTKSSDNGVNTSDGIGKCVAS